MGDHYPRRLDKDMSDIQSQKDALEKFEEDCVKEPSPSAKKSSRVVGAAKKIITRITRREKKGE